jgi:PAS domain S-box-containing protein
MISPQKDKILQTSEELQQLKAENLRLASMMEIFIDGPIVAFTRENADGWPLSHVSANVEKIFGYSAEDFCSGKLVFSDVIASEDLDRVSRTVFAASDSGALSVDLQPYRIKHKDGSLRWVQENSRIVRNSENEVTHYNGYILDITDSKRLSEELEAGKQELDRVQRQQEVIVREIHHRIKNHLQGLISLLRLHHDDNRDDGFVDFAVSKIASIAAVYGIQTSHPDGNIQLLQMLRAIVKSVEGLSKIPITLCEESIPAHIDLDNNKVVALAMVINELIMNAIKHSSMQTHHDVITISGKLQQACVHLSITSPGNLPQEFDFASGNGLGTGLELVSAMLPGNGATLEISSQSNGVRARLGICPPLLSGFELAG